MAEYVVSGASLDCTLGTASSSLSVTPHNVKLAGKDRGNISDATPFENVSPFGNCLIVPSAPKPCVPGCSIWIAGKSDVLVAGMPALLDSDITICPIGGVISISASGQ